MFRRFLHRARVELTARTNAVPRWRCPRCLAPLARRDLEWRCPPECSRETDDDTGSEVSVPPGVRHLPGEPEPAAPWMVSTPREQSYPCTRVLECSVVHRYPLPHQLPGADGRAAWDGAGPSLRRNGAAPAPRSLPGSRSAAEDAHPTGMHTGPEQRPMRHLPVTGPAGPRIALRQLGGPDCYAGPWEARRTRPVPRQLHSVPCH